MAGFSTYLANKLLDHSLGIATYTPPTNIWIALFTADPTDSGVFTNEVADLYAYARVEITGLMTTSVDGVSVSASKLDFADALGGGWGIVTHAMVVDTGVHGTGNSLYVEELVYPVEVFDGDPFYFRADKFQLILV